MVDTAVVGVRNDPYWILIVKMIIWRVVESIVWKLVEFHVFSHFDSKSAVDHVWFTCIYLCQINKMCRKEPCGIFELDISFGEGTCQ